MRNLHMSLQDSNQKSREEENETLDNIHKLESRLTETQKTLELKIKENTELSTKVKNLQQEIATLEKRLEEALNSSKLIEVEFEAKSQ